MNSGTSTRRFRWRRRPVSTWVTVPRHEASRPESSTRFGQIRTTKECVFGRGSSIRFDRAQCREQGHLPDTSFPNPCLFVGPSSLRAGRFVRRSCGVSFFVLFLTTAASPRKQALLLQPITASSTDLRLAEREADRLGMHPGRISGKQDDRGLTPTARRTTEEQTIPPVAEERPQPFRCPDGFVAEPLRACFGADGCVRCPRAGVARRDPQSPPRCQGAPVRRCRSNWKMQERTQRSLYRALRENGLLECVRGDTAWP